MRGLRSGDLVAIMDFLYHGEANILQDDLYTFLALAEELKLKGLTGGAKTERKKKHTGRFQAIMPPRSKRLVNNS